VACETQQKVGDEKEFLIGGGEMRAFIRVYDWAQTPLGPVEGWSSSLRMMVSVLLASRLPILLWWGPQYISIYNDGYSGILAAKHPWALGRPCREIWPEIWHVIEPLIDAPFKVGPSMLMENLELELNRHCILEKGYTVSCSPVPDEFAPGGIGGVLATVHVLTARNEAEQSLRDREEALRRADAELRSGMAALARFTQSAVGRESRMIDLKEEVNRLLERLGESPRYPPARKEAASSAPISREPWSDAISQGLVPLEAVLCTSELHARPSRPADHEAENRALTTLVQALAASPRTILQTLALIALKELRAGSAGVSLLIHEGLRFCIVAAAGRWSRYAGRGVSHTCSPSSDVIERDRPLAFTHWERRYPYLVALRPLVEEGLYVPFHVGGKAVGTVWVLSHDHRRFDAEDLRLLESLGRFASAAYQAVESLKALDQRRAVMNLLEDAMQAQQQAESANRKLQQNEEALREADRRKDQFLALLGHELRNPMSPITTASELLSRMCGDDERVRVVVGIIKRQTAQLRRLVDDLLDVSRITQGRIQLDLRALDLATVVAQAIETVEPLTCERQQEVVVTSSHEPLYVQGDFTRLVQCVVNILTNAVKFSEPCGQIRLRTEAQSSEAIIEVSDDGAGIASELLPGLFEIFVQGHCTLDRAQGGLGIGLSITKQLIEMHAGKVRAASPGLGFGSTFEIRLPRISPPAEQRQRPTFRAQPRRVLIVDDNADSAHARALLLTHGGHETQVALSGQEALERIESFQPDVALLDIGMPGMDGYELARRLRAIPRLKSIRLVALTGYGQIEDRERAFAAGFDEHLVKPVDLEVLERTLAGI
jgi:signal transduction histidine kinase